MKKKISENREKSWKVLLMENRMLKKHKDVKKITVGKTIYEYENGLLVKMTDSNGKYRTYGYEDGMLVKEVYSNGASFTYEYKDGLLTREIYPDGEYLVYKFEDGILVNVICFGPKGSTPISAPYE